MPNSSNTAALIYRPYHLCGVETAVSILSAVLLGVPTGPEDYFPRVDLVGSAREVVQTGDAVEDRSLLGVMRTAEPVSGDNPIPYYLARGLTARKEISAGAVLKLSMVEEPTESMLWKLRAEQDRKFLL